MSDPITVVSYDPAWPETFRQLGAQLREALGGVALRIDHIGSTAVPGLAAKPIVDVQLSVERLEPVEPGRRWRRPVRIPGPPTPSAPSGTSASVQASAAPMSTFGGRAASPSSSPCCSVTSSGPIPQRPWTMANTRWCWRHGFTHDRRGYLDAKTPIIWDAPAPR
jgi:GrpB protein